MMLKRTEFGRKKSMKKTKEQYKQELRQLRTKLDQAKRQVEHRVEIMLTPLESAASKSSGHFYRTGLFYDD